jgi:hypothetical protein
MIEQLILASMEIWITEKGMKRFGRKTSKELTVLNTYLEMEG